MPTSEEENNDWYEFQQWIHPDRFFLGNVVFRMNLLFVAVI